MEKELEVRNLQISFKTNNGNVKAVRGISFDLEKGETLAIVGESGSGKSVTAKAILGILAGNSIVEGGEIIYHGDDLLKYTEKDFNKIRGNKFTMIFQDPLSSLDPIMRIGKQMTEASILNGKTNQKNAKKAFKKKLGQLKKAMAGAGCPSQEIAEQLKAFSRYAQEGGKKKQRYMEGMEYLESSEMTLRRMKVDAHGEDLTLLNQEYKELLNKLDKTARFLELPEQIRNLTAGLEQSLRSSSRDEALGTIDTLLNVLQERAEEETPDFYGEAPFMKALLDAIAKALRWSAEQHQPYKQQAVEALQTMRPVFEKEHLDASESHKAVKELSKTVDQSIDRLALERSSEAYTFRTTMEQGLKRYFEGVHKNPKELARVRKETAEREKKLAKGQETPKVIPPQIVDLTLTRNNLLDAIDNLLKSYEAELTAVQDVDYEKLAYAMVEYLKDEALAIVNRITKQMAYDKAIRIMEDVGIKEPEKRFKQYPFEFSGGMRQRIVIAIAVAANPDILICDEPTTALDVTIQSQILELINEIKRKRNISVIFITHDLGVVANMADKVAVMYAGKIVEYGTVEDIFYEPKHPYTWALLGSMPDLDTKDTLEAIPGTPPNMIYPPVGDAFAERNQYAMQIDYEQQPPMFKVSDSHYAATWLLHPDAPKVDPPKIVTDRIERMKKLEVTGDGA